MHKTNDAIEILHRRYIGSDAQRITSLEREKLNAQIASRIAQVRTEAGLTQKQLAERVGTTQSVISRLEDAQYEGHSLSMLNRIAEALDQHVKVVLESTDPDIQIVRLAFREILRRLRLSHGYTLEDVGSRLRITPAEAVALEQDHTYRASPLLLHRISKLYNIPQRRLALLAGAVRDIPSAMKEHASKFAAMSDSFSKLGSQERKELDEFVKFLRSEV